MAVGTNEKILINYLHEIEYNNDPANSIGSNDSLTLRTAETPAAGTTNYVRKFGTPVSVTGCSAISDLPAGQTMVVYALDGTELARKTAAAAPTIGGTVTAQGVYIELSGAATVVTSPESITLTGLGVHPLVMATETLGASALRLYVSETTSTYYDAAMMYGGARHTPVAGDEDLPYFDIQTAYSALAARTIVHVLDSAIYDEELDLDTASTFLQAALGTTPTITRGVGARASREMVNQGNNLDTAYVSGALALGGVGTYQDPYTTIAAAFAGLAGRTNIHIMDSEIYTESLAFNAAVELEPLYGHTPLLTNTSAVITMTAANIKVYGCKFTGFNPNPCIIFGDNVADIIADCTFTDSYIGIGGTTLWYKSTVSRCLFENNIYGFYMSSGADDYEGTVETSYFTANTYGIYLAVVDFENDGAIINNVIYANQTGILIDLSGEYAPTAQIENCTIAYNTSVGLSFEAVTVSENVANNIIVHNTTWDTLKTGGDAVTIIDSSILLNSGFVDGGTVGDPNLCKGSSPYKLGISADSVAYRTDDNSDDMGAHLRIIEINESDITVNGFFIDGQEYYNNAVYILDTADHTGLILRWCDVYDFQGIAIDLYDDDTDIDATIINNQIYRNGNGIKFSNGGNTIEENLIYKNAVYGIYAEMSVYGIIHNTITGNKYGIYLESTVAVITIKDNILSQNTSNDIYSEVPIIITYNSSDGALTSNVTALQDTNVLTSPLFVDASGDDYNLKVIENGFFVNSKCKDAASDGQDIGAWNVPRSIASEAWKKYQLEWNPRKLDPEYNGKGVTKFEDALGVTNMFEKSHKRIYPFKWDRTQASTEELWKKIQYMSSLVPDRDQGRTKDQCRMRINPLPSQLLLTGTAATISAATKTIVDTNLDLTEDEYKGYWASIKLLSGTGMTIDDALKTGTVAGTPWDVDEHVGRYLHHLGFYFPVLSNTTNAVTLSDPNNELVSGSITWAFELYFKMIKTENQILHLQDDDGLLPTGSFDWYCDFIEMHVVKPGFKTLQERFYWLQETWKTGFNLFLEEL